MKLRQGYPLLAAIVGLIVGGMCRAAEPGPFRAEVLAASTGEKPIPTGQRVPAGWSAFPVGRDPVVLRLAASTGTAPTGRTWLRVTTALDDRLRRRIEVSAGAGGPAIGQLDLRFAHALEMFQLPTTPGQVEALRTHGVALRLAEAGDPVWLLAGGATAPREFAPQLLTVTGESNPLGEFHRRVASLATLQPFGWMEGCVLEGLRDLAERAPAGSPYAAARDAHWRIFVPTPGRLVYENPRSQPGDQRIHSIEDGLPFADLAWRGTDDRVVDIFLGFAAKLRRPDGAIQGGNMLSAEGSYTIAYPLAAAGAARGRTDLAALAAEQLRVRRERLWHDGALWLRHYDDGHRTFRGWARGVAWHALGVARSIEPLRRHGAAGEAEAELRRIAAWILPLQRPDGLWACFVENGGTTPDTSGSAGIATALAHGAGLGVLPPAAGAAARRTLAGLTLHLTPDGFLGGAAQSNRGGEELQRSDYRVLSQMAMGLMAQLSAAVGEVPAR